MTKEWESYAQLSQSQNISFNDDVMVGMSDEEEMERMARSFAGEHYGETLVEVPDAEAIDQDLRDLGIIDNE